MTDKAISPLRQRMIEDMTARHFAEKVQTEEGERTHPRSRGTAVADCGAKRATRDGNEARYAADEPTQIWIATISGRHDLIVRSSGRQEGFAR